MIAVGSVDQSFQPCPLFERVGGKVEHHVQACTEHCGNMGDQQPVEAFGVGDVIGQRLHIGAEKGFEPDIFG